MGAHRIPRSSLGSAADHLFSEKVPSDCTYVDGFPWENGTLRGLDHPSLSFLFATPDSCQLLCSSVPTILQRENCILVEDGLYAGHADAEEAVKTSREPQRLFEKLAADLKAMWSIGHNRIVAKNILVGLRHHELSLESSLCLFDSIKCHLESPIQEYFEMGVILTAAITGTPVDKELREYMYFKDALAELKCCRNSGEDNTVGRSAYTSSSKEIFRKELEVKNSIPPQSRCYRYLQQALDVLDDGGGIEAKREAFQQLPRLIEKATMWMLNTVFKRCFYILVLNDDNEVAALEGLKALYFKHSATFYMAVDFMNSRESTLRTRLLVIEFTSQLVDHVDNEIVEKQLFYFLCSANETFLKHSFIIHNIRCLLQKAFAKVGLESRLFAMLRSQGLVI